MTAPRDTPCCSRYACQTWGSCAAAVQAATASGKRCTRVWTDSHSNSGGFGLLMCHGAIARLPKPRILVADRGQSAVLRLSGSCVPRSASQAEHSVWPGVRSVADSPSSVLRRRRWAGEKESDDEHSADDEKKRGECVPMPPGHDDFLPDYPTHIGTREFIGVQAPSR